MYSAYGYVLYALIVSHITHKLSLFLYAVRLIIYQFDSIFCYQSIRERMSLTDVADAAINTGTRTVLIIHCRSPPSEILETDGF